MRHRLPWCRPLRECRPWRLFSCRRSWECRRSSLSSLHLRQGLLIRCRIEDRRCRHLWHHILRWRVQLQREPKWEVLFYLSWSFILYLEKIGTYLEPQFSSGSLSVANSSEWIVVLAEIVVNSDTLYIAFFNLYGHLFGHGQSSPGNYCKDQFHFYPNLTNFLQNLKMDEKEM